MARKEGVLFGTSIRQVSVLNNPVAIAALATTIGACACGLCKHILWPIDLVAKSSRRKYSAHEVTYRPRAEPRPVGMRPCTDFALLLPAFPASPGPRGCFSAGLAFAGLNAS